jgi:predicted nuclease of predicted toxin-antitoxin system
MPKLLLDQNLSRRLVEPLQRAFPGSAHLSSFNLQSVADREIFDFARLNGFAILSKDADFHHLSFRFGSPPKVIWLRVGNASTAEISEVLHAQAFRIRLFLDDEESSMLVISPDGD